MVSKPEIEVKVNKVEGPVKTMTFGRIEIISEGDLCTGIKINGVIDESIVSLDFHVDAFTIPTVKMEVYEGFFKPQAIGESECHAKEDEEAAGAAEVTKAAREEAKESELKEEQ